MKKKIIIISIVSLVIIGLIAGVLAVVKNKTRDKKAVDVYPVSELSYPSDMYEYGSYSYGFVNSGVEQNIYLMSSQQIEEVKVVEGQEVKAGDVILVYDTTAQELALDLVRADVEIARTAVIVAERELEELKKITPVEDIPGEPEEESTTTTEEEPTEENTQEPVVEDETSEEQDETSEEETTTTEDEAENNTEDVNDSESSSESSSEEDITTEKPEEDLPSEEDISTEEQPEDMEEVVYTKEELEEAIKAKEAEIKTLSIAYQLAQIDLQIMEYQNSSGEVVANFDGVVKVVMDEEEAILNSKPFIVISGESGYTVSAEIGEYSLGNVAIGDVVEMYCYETGSYYMGTISEIGDIPTYSYDMESYYYLTIRVDDTEGLTSGMGMDVTLPSGETDSGSFYLPLAYVAEENGNYYVLKEKNGVLEKAYVSTGKILWGDSIKIYGGVTENDYIAFPHSKDAKEGVKANKASAYDMYY